MMMGNCGQDVPAETSGHRHNVLCRSRLPAMCNRSMQCWGFPVLDAVYFALASQFWILSWLCHLRELVGLLFSILPQSVSFSGGWQSPLCCLLLRRNFYYDAKKLCFCRHSAQLISCPVSPVCQCVQLSFDYSPPLSQPIYRVYAYVRSTDESAHREIPTTAPANYDNATARCKNASGAKQAPLFALGTALSKRPLTRKKSLRSGGEGLLTLLRNDSSLLSRRGSRSENQAKHPGGSAQGMSRKTPTGAARAVYSPTRQPVTTSVFFI